MQEKAMMGDALAAGLTMNTAGCVDMGAPRYHYALECHDADGNMKWADEFDNLVTTAGKTDLVNKYFKGAAYTAAWYLGLKGTGSAAAGDTLASWRRCTGCSTVAPRACASARRWSRRAARRRTSARSAP